MSADPELEERTAAALGRLDAAPGFRLTCPSCGHADGVPHDPAGRLYTCDSCGCRIACGVEMPRLFITHPDDRRFLTLRLASGKATTITRDGKSATVYDQDFSVPLERQYATGFALDLLSGADPGLFQDFLAYLAAKQIADGADVPKANGTTLDEATLG